MNILIAGGTGFIGRMLVPALLNAGHAVSVLGRDAKKIETLFKQSVKAIAWATLHTHQASDYDAIINLTGANIADSRWTRQTKAILLSSRLDSITHLLDWCKHSGEHKPHLYNASAVGFYPLQHEIMANQPGYGEASALPPHNSFSGALTQQWEAAAMKAQSMGMPVTLLRFGVVLHQGEGMLKKLTLPMKLGLGAVMGSGRQPLAWIDADDLVNALVFLLNHPSLTGAINLVAPQVVTHQVFMKTLATRLNRPLLFKMPASIVKILFGEMGEELLLAGQVVSPNRLLEHQFKFQYPSLESALAHEFPS